MHIGIFQENLRTFRGAGGISSAGRESGSFRSFRNSFGGIRVDIF
jgi:hypothetical protein